jgi:hypothetical protein
VNLLIALSLAPAVRPAGARAAPDAGTPPPPGGAPIDALCAGAPSAELELDGNEFQVQAYDAARQLVALRADPDLPPTGRRRFTVRLLHLRDLLLPLPPDAVGTLTEDQRNGRLRLVLTVRREAEDQADAPLPATVSPCRAGEVVDVTPTRARLERDDLVLAERNLEATGPGPISMPEVQVGPIRSAPGAAPVDAEKLRGPLREAGVTCLRQAMRDLHSLNGAMTVELERSAVGEPLPPRIHIDAVVFSPLSSCLPQALLDERPLWDALPPGARIFFPLYFRGSPVVLPPDASGAKAP